MTRKKKESYIPEQILEKMANIGASVERMEHLAMIQSVSNLLAGIDTNNMKNEIIRNDSVTMTREEILKLARGNGYRGELELLLYGATFADSAGYYSDFDAIIKLAEFIWGKELKCRERLYRSNPHERSFIAVQQEKYRYHLHNLLDWVIEGRDVIEYVEKSLRDNKQDEKQ